MNTYGIYAIGVGASGSIGQIQSQALDPGIKHMINGGSGVIDSHFAAILKQAPKADFSTRAIGSALGLIGIDGLALTAAAPLTLYMEKREQGGLKASGLTPHSNAVIDGGMVFPKSLECSHQGFATISYSAIAADVAGDGSNPLTVTEGVDLAGTPHVDEGYTLAPVLIGATEIDGVQKVDIDFGIGVKTSGGGGSVFPQFVSITKRQPVITFTTKDIAIKSAVSESGTNLSAGAMVQLRTCAKNSVPAATGITFGAGAGIAYLTKLDGEDGEDGDDQAFGVTIVPTISGSDAIIVVGTF